MKRLHADLLAQTDQIEAALQEYGQLLAATPKDPTLLYNLSLLYLQSGNWISALESFERLRSVAPGDERAVVGISEALVHLGRNQQVVRLLDPIVHAGAPPEWAVLDWATAQQGEKNLESAISVLALGEAANPKSARIHFKLASLYRLTKQMDKAAAELKEFNALKQATGSTP